MLENADSERAHCMSLISQKQYADVTPCMKRAGEARQTYQENIDGAIGRYDERVDAEVLQAQLVAVAKGLGLWLIPSALLYLLGIGIAWALKGFRKSG